MSLQIRGLTGNIAAVTAENLLTVQTPTDLTKAGYVKIADGDGNEIFTTESGALLTSDEGLVFFDQIDGSAVTPNWQQTTSSMTIVQSAGFITLNSGLATTANAYATLTSTKYIPMYGPLPVRLQISAKVGVTPQANLTIELGLGLLATNAAPTDGCFFRWAANGNFQCVVNNGGSEVLSANISPPPASNVLTLYEIVIVEDQVRFLVNDEPVATILNPVGIAFPTNAGRLPVTARVYNSASVPAQPPAIYVGQVICVQQDMKQNKPWGEVLACLQRGFYQSITSPFAQTANHTNSVAPATVTLSNTTAGYATLGGKFAIAAPAAAATDGIVFAFLNETGYQRTISGIQISLTVTGVAVVTATVLDWAAAVNSSAVSLATVDGAGTWAPRRIPLGVQGLLALAAVGTQPPNINVTFTPPAIVESGRYFHIILATPNGAATATLVYRGTVTILGGYSE